LFQSIQPISASEPRENRIILFDNIIERGFEATEKGFEAATVKESIDVDGSGTATTVETLKV